MARRLFAAVAVCLLAMPLPADSPGAALAEANHWKRLKAMVEPRVAANPNDAEAQWFLSRVRAGVSRRGRRAGARRIVGGDKKRAEAIPAETPQGIASTAAARTRQSCCLTARRSCRRRTQ
jgi:hypothetical protein